MDLKISRRPMSRLVWHLATASAVVAVLGAIAWYAISGLGSAFGAVVGALAVFVFFGSTPLVLEPVTSRSPGASMGVALGFYFVKVFVALGLLALLFNGRLVAPLPLGTTAFVTSLVCTTVLILGYRKARIPAYDLEGDA